jgi:hypothetical protein
MGLWAVLAMLVAVVEVTAWAATAVPVVGLTAALPRLLAAVPRTLVITRTAAGCCVALVMGCPTLSLR